MRAICFLVVVLALGFAAIGTVSASETNGTIETGSATARICKDATCSSFGRVNWKPTGSTPVTITDSGITGYAWGDEIGWINFDPTDSGVTINPNTGALSGYAYANTGSWINFNPTDVAGGTDVGVTINSEGQFTGWAWVSGVNGGWMKFDCAVSATCVKTDWRPVGSRTGAASSGTSGGGGGRGQEAVASSSSPLPTEGPRQDVVVPVMVNPSIVREFDQAEGQEAGVPSVVQSGESPSADSETTIETPARDAIVEFYKRLGLPQPNFEEGTPRLGYNLPLTLFTGEPGRLVWDFTPKAGDDRYGSGPLAVIMEIPAEGTNRTSDERTFSVSLAHGRVTVQAGEEVSIHRGAIFTMNATGREGIEITSFANPLKITLVMPSLRAEAKSQGVYYRSRDGVEWIPVPDVEFTDMTATFYIDHFTDFAVLERGEVTQTPPFTSTLYYYGLLGMLGITIFSVLRFKKTKLSN